MSNEVTSTWVKLHRKIADNPVMRHPTALQVLVWCMVKVQRQNYRHSTRWGAINLLPGEVMVARRELADSLKSTERKIRTALSMLAQEKIISIKTTNTHSIITLTNWAFLQAVPVTATSTRPALDQHSTQEQEVKKKEPSLGKPKAIPNREYMDVFCEAWALRAKGTKYFVTARDGQRLKLLLQAGLELERWRLAVPAYLNVTDDWIKSVGFPMWALCDNFNVYGASQPTARKQNAL